MNDPISRHEWNGLSEWVKDIDTQLKTHTLQEVRMEERISKIEDDVKEIKTDVKALLDIWTEAKGAMKLFTTVVGLLAAGWAFIEWLRSHFHF